MIESIFFFFLFFLIDSWIAVLYLISQEALEALAKCFIFISSYFCK